MQTQSNAPVRTKVTVAVAIFIVVNLLLSTVVHAAVAMRGQLSFQLQTAGAPIAVEQLTAGKAYQDFEAELLRSISDGKKSIELIRSFDQVTSSTWDQISTRILSMLVRKDGDEFWDMLDKNPWVGPLFRYVEGGEDDVPPYVIVNTDLRSGTDDTEDTIKWVTEMRQSMSRLPKYQGISFRGTRLDKARLEKYFPLNGRASDLAFISTSISVETAQKFARLSDSIDAVDSSKINVLMVVKGHTGRAVSNFARMHSHEQEILFANGTPFKVIAKSPVFKDENLGGASQIIILEEEK